jgi:hypothetical protein
MRRTRCGATEHSSSNSHFFGACHHKTRLTTTYDLSNVQHAHLAEIIISPHKNSQHHSPDELLLCDDFFSAN